MDPRVHALLESRLLSFSSRLELNESNDFQAAHGRADPCGSLFGTYITKNFITTRSELRKVLFLALCDFFAFFVRESNISGTAERICAKLTGKTCLVLRSKVFECQGQRSKVKVTRDKKRAVHSSPPPGSDKMERTRCK